MVICLFIYALLAFHKTNGRITFRNIGSSFRSAKDGKTAHDIFGEDLKAYCDELINSSEHQDSFQQTAVIGFAVSLLLAVQIGYDTFTTLMQKLFSNTNTSGIPFSIPGTILSAIVLTIGAFITFSLFRRFSFTILVSWKQKHSS